MKIKTETLNEFLARGGVVKTFPAGEPPKDPTVRSTTVGPAVILSLEDGELFYGEKRAKKPSKVSKSPKVVFDDLPDALKDKLMARSKRCIDEA
jgi:hypothetical protein